MKSKAQEAYEKVQTRLLRAPGMIEESERRLLFKSAYGCQDLPIVEFGSFFGASTLALACGLAARNTNKYQLFCVDAFEVENDHCFHKHVLQFAKTCRAEKLLRHENTKTNWMNVTKAVLGDSQERVKLVKGIVDDDFDMSFIPEKIGLLHLDLPKDGVTLLPILREVFPKLAKGSILIFQDYAYHFSSELIAFFEILEQKGCIRPVNIAASSIFFEVISEKLDKGELVELLATAQSNQINLIKNAVLKYQTYPGARDQELIALKGSAIWAIKMGKLPNTFDKQAKTSKLIKEMVEINKDRTAFVLAELLTEMIENHQ